MSARDALIAVQALGDGISPAAAAAYALGYVAGAESSAVGSASFQSVTFEDPATLPFALPAGLDDVTADWMTRLLQHRGILDSTTTVTAIVKKGVGMTAGYFSAIAKVACTFSGPAVGAPVNYVVKAWPPLELLPKEAIGNMFVNDILGYANFEPADFYPRPDCFLASYDVAKNLYALVLADADDTGEHKVHENGLTLEEVKKMIPKMAQHAALFEDVHQEGHRYHDACKAIPEFRDPAYLGVYHGKEGKPFSDGAAMFDKWVKCDVGGAWGKQEPSLADYSVLFERKYDAFFARCKDMSMTLSHGDLRGDNLFFTDTNEFGWQAIDFQLMFKGPIPSDIAYLMSSGTVLPDVYEAHEGEVLRVFYDEFQKHTTKYTTASGYTFERFVEEYSIMAHLMYMYFVAMGAVIWMSSAVDGKLDPSQPDTTVGPIGASPEIGTGAIKVEDLGPEDVRKRMWWSKAARNFIVLFNKYGGKAFLESLPDNGSSTV